MANGVCDIDNKRPATHTVRVKQNNREVTLELCSVHYSQLVEQQARTSPFESLFSGNGAGSIFDTNFPEFASQIGTPLPREATDISEFISESTKDIIQQAADTALSFGRTEVDTEHLLYVLADNEVIQEILKQFKLSSADIKGYIDANSPKGDLKDPEKADVTVSPRIKMVLEEAFRSSRQLGHSYIGPEHLLIGLLAENEGMASDILRKYDITPESLRQKVIKVVGQGAENGRFETQSATPKLDKYSRDLTVLAQEGKLDPVIGRAKEIESTIEILARRTKNNPVLIGEPGVGKTAIIEGLAQRIFNGKVPQVLQDKRVVELNLNSMVAGSKYRGEFEERIQEVLDEIVDHQDELVIFIDELHTIVGAGQGGGEGGMDVSNIIKPSLARGELHLIGATTLNEYQKYIEKDAALERRFQPVLVPEPTVDQTIEILRGLRDRYEAHHKVKITDEAIVAAAELSDRYISNRFLPDKAIDLVDQAASRVRISVDTYGQDIDELDNEIKQLKRERDYAVNHKEMDKAKELDERLKTAEEKKNTSAEQWQAKKGVTSESVLIEHIAQVISSITGIPVQELTQEEREKLLRLEDILHERVIGQEQAVEAVSDAVRLSRSGLAEGNRPIASLMFLGPTGVGKTELAKALAYAVFGDEDAIIRIDMSEYMEKHSVARLIGAPPGYVGYDEGGQLTERVRRKPYSVLLLDEIEKAHPDVSNILLQVLDDGRLTDGKGRVVDFTNTIIIATSNVGAHLIAENLGAKKEYKKSYAQLKQDVMEILRQHFRPEFLNRIDEIIVFEALDKNQIEKIVKLQLERVMRQARGQGIELTFDTSVVKYLSKIGYLPEYGARELRRQIKSELEKQLAKEMLGGDIKDGSVVIAIYDEKSGITFKPVKL